MHGTPGHLHQVTLTHPDGTTTEAGQPVMVTGHRNVEHPVLVAERLDHVIARLNPNVAISGGAAGADRLWAEAALRNKIPLRLVLPNRWYVSHYPGTVDEATIAMAEVTYAVERPDVADWARLWDSERWWRDNHVRNAVMVATSTTTVVVSPRPPRTLLGEQRGGTAACVREVLRRRGDGCRVIWVPDDPDRVVCIDTLRR